MRKFIQILKRLFGRRSIALTSFMFVITPAFAFSMEDFTESFYGQNDSVETLASFEIAKQIPILKDNAIWEFGLEYEGSIRKITDNNKVIYKNKIIF